jgi:hypothetical protein
MMKIGPLACLTQVSLLIGLNADYSVSNLRSYSNAQVTLKTSDLWNKIPKENRKAFALLNEVEYSRIETAYRDFSAAFLLSIHIDANSPAYLKAFWKLKVWCACQKPDEVCKFLKFNLKIAQAVFLRSEMPELVKGPIIYRDIPQLMWIYEAYNYGTRDYPLTVSQAYQLTQIANFLRAGPYPSHEMVKEDVVSTLDLIKEDKKISAKALRSHSGGLKQVFERLHEPDSLRTHVSLSGSGCFELGRADGGKAGYLVQLAKRLASLTIGEPKELGSIVGLCDCMGQEVLSNEVARMALTIMRTRKVTWGEVLYLPPERASIELATEEERVPYGLAALIVLVCTRDLEKLGFYDKKQHANLLGVPLFERSELPVEFQPTVTSLPVKASMSIEGAGKSRMVTSAMAAVTEVGELINHFMRNWLSKDPFCRVGFEEADKLWEVLKTYSKSRN